MLHNSNETCFEPKSNGTLLPMEIKTLFGRNVLVQVIREGKFASDHLVIPESYRKQTGLARVLKAGDETPLKEGQRIMYIPNTGAEFLVEGVPDTLMLQYPDHILAVAEKE